MYEPAKGNRRLSGTRSLSAGAEPGPTRVLLGTATVGGGFQLFGDNLAEGQIAEANLHAARLHRELLGAAGADGLAVAEVRGSRHPAHHPTGTRPPATLSAASQIPTSRASRPFGSSPSTSPERTTTWVWSCSANTTTPSMCSLYWTAAPMVAPIS